VQNKDFAAKNVWQAVLAIAAAACAYAAVLQAWPLLLKKRPLLAKPDELFLPFVPIIAGSMLAYNLSVASVVLMAQKLSAGLQLVGVIVILGLAAFVASVLMLLHLIYTRLASSGSISFVAHDTAAEPAADGSRPTGLNATYGCWVFQDVNAVELGKLTLQYKQKGGPDQLRVGFKCRCNDLTGVCFCCCCRRHQLLGSSQAPVAAGCGPQRPYAWQALMSSR
jgi:hypothetical protein